jgi:type IV pilus assembly protein PilC
MANYQYKAVDDTGRLSTGQIDAINEIDLEIKLERTGFTLINYKLADKQHQIFNAKKINAKDLMMFCFQLEQLTSAGVPLLEGLSDLREINPNPHFQKVIAAMVSEIEGGKMLSQALASHEEVFDPVFVSLVAAGEKTGELSVVFDHLASTYKWQDEVMAQAKKLVGYPIFVLGVVIAAVSFLMIYLVPQMVTFLNNMGQELPLQTQILIVISNIFVDFWWVILMLPVMAAMLVPIMIKKSDSFRYWFDDMKLKMPVTGSIMKKIILARFARYFALMYQSGIPVLEAIRICEEISDNQVIIKALQQVQYQINAGESMGESFQNAGLFPPLVVRMIKVGESSGGLNQSLLKISYFYDRDVSESIESMMKMLEPALTVILGLILAFIMVSVLGPVYDSYSRLQL